MSARLPSLLFRKYSRRPRTYPGPPGVSSTQAETGDKGAVTLDVFLSEVGKKALALTNQQHQTTTRVVIMLVGTEVLGQLLDASGQQSHLNLGGTGVTLMRGVFGNDLLLLFRLQGHDSPSRSRCTEHRGMFSQA